MREFLAARIEDPFSFQDCWDGNALREYRQEAKDQVERELRTALMAGVDPAEFAGTK